jgi:hypothetical protein
LRVSLPSVSPCPTRAEQWKTRCAAVLIGITIGGGRRQELHRRPVGGHRRTRERKHGNKARTDRESQTKCRWGVEWSIFLLPVPCYFHQCGRSGSTSAPAHRESSTSAAFVAARSTATEEDKEDAALDRRCGHALMRGWPEATDRLELSRATEDRWSMRGSSR